MTISANFPNVQPSLLLDFANAKQLPPSVNFTRATTATYYDGSTTAKAEQNLVQYSQEFDNAVWSPSNTTIVANNTTAPDGTSTADKVVIAANTSFHDAFANGFQRTANQTYTHSIYVKAGTGIPAVYLYTNRDAVGLIAKFDVSAGTYIGNAGANGYGAFDSYSITSVGSGWYRITATFTAASNSSSTFTLGISTTTADTVVPITGNGTDFCYIWGAQLEQRSSATAYTATTTQAITNYIPVLLTAGGGQPRFDHNPTTSESLGLLIEEQRTNVSLYSSYFASGWTRDFSSVTANSVVAPDGTLSAATLVEDTTTNFHLAYPAAVTAAAATYTASVYLKQAGRRYAAVQIYINGATSRYTILVDLSNGSFVSSNNVGTPTSTSYSITSVGNDWYRVSVTAAQTSTSSLGIAIGASSSATPSYSSGLPVYAGNGWNSIYFWGAQVEAGAFPTSYIPTTSASATRAADVVSMSGANFSSWYSPGNGTFYAEAATASVAGDVMIAEGTNSSNGYLDFSLTFATTGTQFINRFVATNNDMRRSSVVAVNTMVKFSGSITNSTGTTVASVSGLTVSSAGSQGANFGADRMFIGSRGGSSLFINAPIKKFAFYPAQLTQTQQNSITG
jgi:hypothetical protein